MRIWTICYQLVNKEIETTIFMYISALPHGVEFEYKNSALCGLYMLNRFTV